MLLTRIKNDACTWDNDMYDAVQQRRLLLEDEKNVERECSAYDSLFGQVGENRKIEQQRKFLAVPIIDILAFLDVYCTCCEVPYYSAFAVAMEQDRRAQNLSRHQQSTLCSNQQKIILQSTQTK